MNKISQFEQSFADWSGAVGAFAFWKARVAAYAILKALDVADGDEVILPGYTCVMDVNPIKYLGARPVYVDIESDTYNIDVSLLERAITPRTKVILAQHTYGFPCEMDAILDIASRHGLPVVEDCCLALGSVYKNRMCGTFGVAAYWSFQWNKPFTTGLGGMATVNDTALAGRIAALCDEQLHQPPKNLARMLAAQRVIHRAFIYPRTTALATHLFRWLVRKGIILGSSSNEEFTPQMAHDFVMGMSAGQARAGLREIGRIDRNIAHRRKMAKLYDELLGQAGWYVPHVPEYVDPVLVRYPVRVADKQKAIAEATGHLIELGTWFECPLHPIETPLALYDYHLGMCPQAEKASREVVNLPTHPRANHRAAKRSVAFVQSIGAPD